MKASLRFGEAFLNYLSVLAAVVIHLLKFAYHTYITAVCSSVVRVFFGAVGIFLLWPLVDGALLHFNSGATFEQILAQVTSRWHWLTGLTFTFTDNTPSGVTTMPLFRAACSVLGLGIVLTSFVTLPAICAAWSSIIKDIEDRARLTIEGDRAPSARNHDTPAKSEQ